MLSSRLSLGIGTLSLVVVTSVSTAVLVNDSAQRLAEPAVTAPQVVEAPTFRAAPLVVPSTPGTVVTRTVVPRAAPPQKAVPATTAGRPPSRGQAPLPAPAPSPEPAPVTEAPVVDPGVVDTPEFVGPVLKGKGKHLGQLKHGLRVKGPKKR